MTISLLLIFFFNKLSAQETDGRKLVLGDDGSLLFGGDMLNFDKKDLNVNEKIVIVDFWDSHCISCLESWEKLLKLQEKFSDEIQIILANYNETESKIVETIKRQEKVYGYRMTLPVLYGNKDNLKFLVPRPSFPHVIFLEKGRIKYITNGSALNEKTIQSIIEGQNVHLPLKDDYLKPYDFRIPLFVNGNVSDDDKGDNVFLSSVITPYTDNMLAIATINCYNVKTETGYLGSSKRPFQAKYIQGSFTNAYFGQVCVKSLFQILYGGSGDNELAIRNYLTLFENLDSTNFVSSINGEIQYKNLFALQFTAKKFLNPEMVKEKLIRDLELYFNVKTCLRKMKKPALVFSRNQHPISEYKDGDKLLLMGNTKLHVRNATIQEMVNLISGNTSSWVYGGYPIVDETNFSGKLQDVHFVSDEVIDWKILRDNLKKYGIDVTLQERILDVLVIGPNASHEISKFK